MCKSDPNRESVVPDRPNDPAVCYSKNWRAMFFWKTLAQTWIKHDWKPLHPLAYLLINGDLQEAPLSILGDYQPGSLKAYIRLSLEDQLRLHAAATAVRWVKAQKRKTRKKR